jgi:plasmid maintenance system antidote protein VapI
MNGRYRDTPLSRAIELMGGPSRAAAKMHVTRQAMALWRTAGYVTRRDMAIRMARLSGVAAESLMALPPGDAAKTARVA